MSNIIEDKYINGDYIDHNPTWDIEHSPRKASELYEVIPEHVLEEMFKNNDGYVLEIGCGAGGVIYHFSELLTNRNIGNNPIGVDISPTAIEMARNNYGDRVQFTCSRDVELGNNIAVTLLVDVLEHLTYPEELLQKQAEVSNYFLIRLPLDLSLWNISLNRLKKLEKELGHIHYFTYKKALNFIQKQGLVVVSYDLTNNYLDKCNRSTFVSKCMFPVRWLTSMASKKVNSILWGGNSIVILAKRKKQEAVDL